jgi:hypothetical protein
MRHPWREAGYSVARAPESKRPIRTVPRPPSTVEKNYRHFMGDHDQPGRCHHRTMADRRTGVEGVIRRWTDPDRHRLQHLPGFGMVGR